MAHKLTLFIFRRDLRLADNIGLINALQQSKLVIPGFIFDPRQCINNDYKSTHCLQFMLESIKDLQAQLHQRHAKLFLFYGEAEQIIHQLITHKKIDAVYFNEDYTPFSQQRDQAIVKLCQQQSIACQHFADTLLCGEPLVKTDGTPYKVFSPFYKKARNLLVAEPLKNNYHNYYQGKISQAETSDVFKKILPNFKDNLGATGGRSAALVKLKELKLVKSVVTAPDYLFGRYTSDLSPHLKFTTCSVREVYHAIKKQVANPDAILRELYWRDFFSVIGYHLPQVFGQAYQAKYQNLEWHNDKKLFKLWCQGKTGFPIVDAGMRQLRTTGYLRNRLRLITASFLIKDLQIDWRWGERYFAQQLLDYDPAVNNGNWQWVAGTGTDVQPYFRIFNPWLQQRKFDPDCLYIKQWLPELATVDKKIIHNWHRVTVRSESIAYISPMIDHKVQAARTKAIYTQQVKV